VKKKMPVSVLTDRHCSVKGAFSRRWQSQNAFPDQRPCKDIAWHGGTLNRRR